jgi:catechol 2,3-dioxygenase-like lactoylglutathione lyase family enzyme
MPHDIDGLHHVGLLVEDLDEGTELYRRLGFQMTPPSHHSVAPKEGEPPRRLGTANTIATFPRNYVEVLAQVDKSMQNPILDPWYARFAGLHILAFNSPDADAVAARLDGEGINHGGVSTLQREVDTADGPRMMRVRNVFFGGEDSSRPVVAWSASQLPEGGVQTVQNLTVEYLLQERYMEHPNGAIGVVDYILCVADDELPDFERRYGKYLARTAQDDGPARVFDVDGFRVTLVRNADLDAILPGERAPDLPAFVAYGVAVRDLGAARTLLKGNGFQLVEAGSRVFVPAAEALGGAVMFSQAG